MGGLAAAGSIGSAAISSSAAGKAADTQATAAGDASKQIEDYTQKGVDALSGSTTKGVDYLAQILQLQQQFQQPYQTAGTTALDRLSSGFETGGEFTQKFDPGTVQMDPGFDFRLKQGQQTIERSAAAKGGALGGAALKSLERYAQDYSSGEYGNAYNRTYNAYQQDRTNQVSGLQNLVSTGQTAANAMTSAAGSAGAGVAGLYGAGGSNLAGLYSSAGRSVADLTTGAANARASGYVGSANAWGSGISGAGSSILDAYLASQLGKKSTSAIV